MKYDRINLLAFSFTVILLYLSSCGSSVYLNDTLYDNSSGQNALEAPSNLQANSMSDSQIELTWTDLAGDKDGFKIERSLEKNGIFENVAGLDALSTSYTDNQLEPATAYFYRVAGFKNGKMSPFSEIVAASTHYQDTESSLLDASLNIKACIYHESIESLTLNPDLIEIKDGQLTWTTSFMYPGQAYKPGEHPDCINSDLSETYLTLNGVTVELPIDDVHWELFVSEIRLNGVVIRSYHQWVGKFDLAQLFSSLNIDESKADRILEVTNNNYHGENPVGWITLLGDNLIRIIYSGLVLKNSDGGEEFYLQTPDWYDFSLSYEYYGWSL